MYADEMTPHCACGRQAYESCCCCGAPLCPMCFETGAGFCRASDCFTEERIEAMEREMRGEDDNPFLDL